MKCMCPKCGEEFEMEEESPEHEAGESSEYEGGEMEEEEGGDSVVIKNVQVPPGKEELIKKKLFELGKMLASIK